ncbi:DUF1330 domain-containing protein [Accumulibacter sp.]|uniref:DUF1330 domain-containing protein n=1 Tax=Accumulibacter sp. TaxID=2053492 RepID=UPI00261EC87E|nr:DUF1330 domain-containing protein [Accumulibacter sp.]
MDSAGSRQAAATSVKVVGLIKLVDRDAFDEYRRQVGETVAKYRGRVAARGASQPFWWNELHCEAFDAFVELEFPTLDDAQQWATSEDYRKLLDVRRRAMRLTLFAVE